MAIFAYSVATACAIFLGLSLYQFATALVARACGAEIRRIVIGGGPALFRQSFHSWTVEIRLLPIIGFTELKDSQIELEDGSVEAQPFTDLSPASQVLTSGAGPFGIMFLGAALLAVPVWLGANQLLVANQVEIKIRPSAVPGLGIIKQPCSWESQGLLLRQTILEYFTRIVTFRSLEGWGGFVGFLVTCGSGPGISSYLVNLHRHHVSINGRDESPARAEFEWWPHRFCHTAGNPRPPNSRISQGRLWVLSGPCDDVRLGTDSFGGCLLANRNNESKLTLHLCVEYLGADVTCTIAQPDQAKTHGYQS